MGINTLATQVSRVGLCGAMPPICHISQIADTIEPKVLKRLKTTVKIVYPTENSRRVRKHHDIREILSCFSNKQVAHHSASQRSHQLQPRYRVEVSFLVGNRFFRHCDRNHMRFAHQKRDMIVATPALERFPNVCDTAISLTGRVGKTYQFGP